MHSFFLALIDSPESLKDAISMSRFGDMVILAGLGLTIATFLSCLIGMTRKDERFIHAARQGQYLVFLTAVLGCGVLWTMLFDGMYVSNYVHRISEQQEEFFFKVVGLWASQEGSVLFWCLILSLVGAVFAFANRHTRTDRRLPATLLVLYGVEIFFFSLMLSNSTSPFTLGFEWINNPEWAHMTVAEFAKYWSDKGQLPIGIGGSQLIDAMLGDTYDAMGQLVARAGEAANGIAASASHAMPDLKMGELYERLVSSPQSLPTSVTNVVISAVSDGRGMNPQLHNYWIAIHPPTLYLGYIGFTIPFCYAVGSLISGELGTEWIRRARLWTMTAWVFLTAGIAMGGLWAYEILGWGGYWAWDPVENASFIPWLTATAFIHSVIVQERRGMLRSWNVLLIILTYCMTIIGTFLVRAGIVESVHAFGDTGLKWPLIGFMTVVFLGSILLVVWRLPLLRADRRMDTVVSREGIFLVNNLVLVLIALITLTMTLWPAFSELLFGTASKHTFGETAYTMVNAPLFLILLFLTGVGPVLAYGRSPWRQVIRQLAWPFAISGFVMAINVIRIHGLGIAKVIPDDGDALSTGVSIVRRIVQYTLFPILALVLASVVQELWQAGELRRRIVGGSRIAACFGAVMANRRRFGGYAAHIGMVLVAAGIYLSSFYETDTSAQMERGGYTVVGRGDEQWAMVNDLFTPSPLYRELTGDDQGLRDPNAQKILHAARLLRMNPQMSDDDLKSRTYSNVTFPETAKMTQTQRGAVAMLQTNPGKTASQVIDEVLQNAPMLRDNPERIATMRAGMAAVENWLTLSTADLATVREMAKSTRSFEYYQSTVRLIRHRPTPLSEPEVKAFMEAYSTALRTVPSKGPDCDEMRKLDDMAFQYGPDIFPVLHGIDAGLIRDVAEHRAFHRMILKRLHDRERDAVKVYVAAIAVGTDQVARKHAEEELSRLSWRALGGLRDVESYGSEAERKEAQSRITPILATADTVRPRIQMFFNKRTGEPRPDGESVRDPEIVQHWNEDVYLILQGVEIRDPLSPEADIAIFRIFIKPGMMLGLAGLVIIVLGSVFALLPRRRRAGAPEA